MPPSASPRATLTVVIPTRHRPALVRNAVRSVLEQAGDRVRVVVSDNSDDPADRAAVATFVQALPVRRVIYLGAPPRLAMTAHWEWALQCALERSPASHVAFLTDRMIFRPGFLDELLDIADRYPNDVVSYNYDTVEDTTLPAHLELEPWSGRLLVIEPARFLACASRGVLSNALPRMLNTLVPARVLDSLRRRFGSVFASVSPDVCFAFRTLAHVERLLYYDKPGLVQYAIGRSQGINYRRGLRVAEVLDFATLSGAGGPAFAAAPVPEFQTMLNATFHEYALVAAEAGSDRFPDIDLTEYYGGIAWDALTMWDRKRARTVEAALRAHGWTHAKTAAWFLRRAGGVMIHNPGRLAAAALRPFHRQRHFVTSEAAVAYAIAHPRRRSGSLAHQWQLRPHPIDGKEPLDRNPDREALLSA